MEFAPLPASSETVSYYIASMLTADLKVSTMTRRISAVNQRHKALQLPSPVTQDVRDLLRACKRQRHDRVREVRPLDVEHVRAISKLLEADGTRLASRDRCILLVGLASALRSASLVALAISDVEFTSRGVILYVGHSKTDQIGKGAWIAVPPGEHAETCPIRALREWIARRGAKPGVLFTRYAQASPRPMQPERLCQIVQRRLKQIGVAEPGAFGSHSMRAGMITAAAEGGASELLISAVSLHKDMATLRKYFRKTDLWRANASGMIGL